MGDEQKPIYIATCPDYLSLCPVDYREGLRIIQRVLDIGRQAETVIGRLQLVQTCAQEQAEP